MKVRITSILITALLLTLLLVGITQAAVPPLLPFNSTADLFVLDSGSGSILRITPGGTVTVEVTKAQIEGVAGGVGGNYFGDNSIAFDADGTLYFVASVIDESAIFKRVPGGPLTMLASELTLELDVGGDVDADGIAFGSDGLLYVSDDIGERVLQVDPDTGTAFEYVTKADFEALAGLTSADMEVGIVGASGGIIYVASEGTPNAIIAIAPDGTFILASGDPPFADLDVFMTRAANGDLIVADNSDADMIHRVTPAGVVSTFLSEAELEAVTGADVDLEGGIAFDCHGNFYVAESESDSILKFDSSLNGSTWVSADDIAAVTGTAAELDGGIAFIIGPTLTPGVGGEFYPVNKPAVLVPWVALAAAIIAGGILLLRRRADV